MSEIIKLPITCLTPEAFAPYGHVLQSGKPLYPDVGDDNIELRLYDIRIKPKQIGLMAFHDSYNQSFISIAGAMIMIVALPIRPDALKEGESIHYDSLVAFLFQPGDAALINHGVGHFAVPVGDVCRVVNVTRKHRPEQRPIEEMVEGRQGFMKSVVEIEFVDFGEKDGKLLEIEFQA